MATFGFRFYNANACYKMKETLSMVAQSRKTFTATSYFTDVPYPGFNDRGFCGPRQNSAMTLNAKDPEHYELIHIFLSGSRKIGMTTAKLEQKIANIAEENRKFVLRLERVLKAIGFFFFLIYRLKYVYKEGQQEKEFY